MNKEYELWLGSSFTKVNQLTNPALGYTIDGDYSGAYELLLPALKEHKFINDFTLEPHVKIDWRTMDEIKKDYPMVRGDNPNVNIMKGIESALKDYCEACNKTLGGINNGSFEKLNYRQCARDLIMVFQDRIIKDFTLWPNMSVKMEDPSKYLSKNQLEKIAAKNARSDLGHGPGR
jgi:hypothetical protein